MKRVLQIAFDFPPCQSAGVQRTLKLAEQLPEFGWKTAVLTARPGSYPLTDFKQPLPEEVNVYRAWALDASRHLAIGGKYLGITAIPDRYASWILPAIVKGLVAIKREKPDLIWSTYPVPSAHCIALILSKLSGIPWIADYRDPAPFHYIDSNKDNAFHRWLDHKTVQNAAGLVFATEPMRQLYLDRYPDLEADRTHTVENGFNQELFSSIRSDLDTEGDTEEFIFLHSGALYNNGRNPVSLFKAIAQIRSTPEGKESLNKIKITFRGAKPEQEYKDLVAELGLGEIVEFLPSVPYAESIEEMLQASALLLIQGGAFDYQIPGKAYEYIASERPILALCGKSGATYQLLERVPGAVVVDDDDVNGIANALLQVIKMEPYRREVERYNRRCRSQAMAELMEATLNIASTNGR